MFAPYPLVRNLQCVSRPARASLASPSRSGSSPSSTSSRLISWSTLVFYIALFPPLACASSYASWFQGGSPAQAAPQDDPDALYRDALGSRPRRSRLPTSGPRALAANPRDFESAWKLARAHVLARHAGPHAESGALRSSAAPMPDAARRHDRAVAAGRLLLDGGQHGHARRVVRPASGHRSIVARSRTRSRPYCGSIPRFRTDRRTARSAAGSFRCRGCSAAARRNRRNTFASRSTYAPKQHRVALLSRRDALRHGPRCARHARSCRR